MEDDVSSNGAAARPIEPEVVRKGGAKLRAASDSALHVLSDTPGWVWAVVGGVILLMIGILAASRYRMRHQDHA
jgi:hypothetical protein